VVSAGFSWYYLFMKREKYISLIKDKLKTFKTIALLGPRQVGKTTIARQLCEETQDFNFKTNYFDLENPTDLARLNDPKLALQNLSGLVIIDEVQKRPALFETLRYLLDRKDNKMQILVLGSASRDLIKQSSESLAGRISYIEVSPFSLNEIENPGIEKLWLCGGMPLSFFFENTSQSFDWLQSYIKTYLERDIPSLGINIPSETISRFWMMLTHSHGNILNTSELGKSFGIADTTARRYVDILIGTFMIRQLQPYYANIKKRQVKSPKIYFRDSGILHSLLGINDYDSLQTHPRCGASWEGFALEQVLNIKNPEPENTFFWAVHAQAEIDLIIKTKNKLEGYEFKYSSAPSITRSLNNAIEHLDLDTITIVAPVDSSYQLSEKIEVKPLDEII
jgi:predicted AAA+ superfamily ATPase